MNTSITTLAAGLGLALAPAPAVSPDELAQQYADAIRELNEKHARSPGKTSEDELAQKLPATARKAFEQLLASKASEELAPALVVAAEAAIDLDLERDFEAARAAVEKLSAEEARKLGRLVSRERFVVRGLGGLDTRYLEHFADVFGAVLEGYDEVFGFAEYSKVPGKKLRVRVHLEPKIERPPHFAPQFPFHSEIDFPVVDAERLGSPTADGKFLFYGLCHELGHVVAMWGDRDTEEDHHAWAHYTGVAIVEHLANEKARAKLLDGLNDVRWRSLAKEREALKGVGPSFENEDGVMATLVALHDALGPEAIGTAINSLDAGHKALRINGVRYYAFRALKKALLEGAANDAQRKAVKDLLP